MSERLEKKLAAYLDGALDERQQDRVAEELGGLNSADTQRLISSLCLVRKEVRDWHNQQIDNLKPSGLWAEIGPVLRDDLRKRDRLRYKCRLSLGFAWKGLAGGLAVCGIIFFFFQNDKLGGEFVGQDRLPSAEKNSEGVVEFIGAVEGESQLALISKEGNETLQFGDDLEYPVTEYPVTGFLRENHQIGKQQWAYRSKEVGIHWVKSPRTPRLVPLRHTPVWWVADGKN